MIAAFDPLAPPTGFPVVGMVGGGQLARMTAQAAIALGVDFRVLAASPADSAARATAQGLVGNPNDPAVAATFAAQCDVVTFDHEQVPPEVLAAMAATGVPLRPGIDALVYAQDKAEMRRRLTDAGLPAPPWQVVGTVDEALGFAARLDSAIVLKVSRGGYDGRGVWVCENEAEIRAAMANQLPADVQWVAEAKVPFAQELSAMVVRSVSGEKVAYPVVKTTQTNGMCTQVVAPAPGLPPAKATDAQAIALQVSDLVGVVGVLAVEMFDTADGVLINELAMRPHNSGHWTMDGAVTSQFENHLRAILDLPLGEPDPVAPWTVMANVVGRADSDLYAGLNRALDDDSGARVHLYAKESRAGRKLGHVNVTGSDLGSIGDRADAAAMIISGPRE